jgi:hypothetical protein
MTKLLQVLTHTPPWVFAILLLLVVLGVRQLQDTQVRPARLATMPVVMVALSLYGVVSAFGLSPGPVAVWALGALLAVAAVMWRTAPGVRYDSTTRTVQVPGSAAPLWFMMGIFLTKYAVNVAFAMNPALREDAALALAASAAYGAFSGFFAGRALRVLRQLLRGAALQGEPLS